MSAGDGTLRFDVYGLQIAVSGEWAAVLDPLRLDLAWFERTASTVEPADVEVEIVHARPDLGVYAPLRAAFVTPRNTVYQRDGLTIIDYSGRAAAVFDRAADRITISGTAAPLVHEAAYHFLLSRAGLHLDAIGMPRLHALALSSPAGATAVMLPSGGGKTTLALRALRSAPGVRLISEDTPLLDRGGNLHPFVLRIGLDPAEAEDLGLSGLRRIERMEFHPKVALEVERFADRVETEPRPLRHLVIGRRVLGTDARLLPAPLGRAIGPLLREAVIGVGVYQGMEFVLQRGARDVLANAPIAVRRAARCAAALRDARVWILEAGSDREANLEALRPLLV